MYLLAFSLAAALPAERRVLARRGWAGENDGLFEHLDVSLGVSTERNISAILLVSSEVFS